jgi:hypothetical protein
MRLKTASPSERIVFREGCSARVQYVAQPLLSHNHTRYDFYKHKSIRVRPEEDARFGGQSPLPRQRFIFRLVALHAG